ncbi:MAG: class I SAM-dependent methyltransferase [Thermoplasmata archaeon]
MSRTESSPMYRDLAVYYDRIYSKKPYRAQTAVLVRLARRFGRSGGRRWLDVACGTGRHLEYLRREFEVTGVDLSGTMLRLARRRLPGVRLVRADMRSFALGERFDVVSCLFSAIGYLRNEREIRQAFRAFASHLLPGGVLLIEPWIAPGQYRPGHVSLDVYQDATTKIVRAGTARRRGTTSRIVFDYLLGEEGRGFRHVREVEDLRLVPYRRLRRLLAETGLSVRWVGPDPKSRGVLVGVRTR